MLGLIFSLEGCRRVTLYLVTFDLHGARQPPGNLYTDIYSDIRKQFQAVNYCKDFGQICLVRSDEDVAVVKNRVKAIIDRYGNQFSSRDIVVFSVGEEISISRGTKDEELRKFRQFFRNSRNASEYPDLDRGFY
ncbi:hypothetical protein [Dankookia sp. P2]|uniref:hypothetical protein n=1 Tax=Dankookia sp. P2 TaxID=3423955 RepID=UPI003D67F3C3